MHPDLAYFKEMNPKPDVTNTETFDRALEKVGETFQLNLAEFAECAERVKLEYVRSYWCNLLIQESAKSCGGENRQICRVVNHRVLDIKQSDSYSCDSHVTGNINDTRY